MPLDEDPTVEQINNIEQDVKQYSQKAVRVFTVGSLVPDSYDYVSVAYPNTTTETYTFKSGGASGTTVATVSVVYTDATKENLSSVTKS